MNENLWPNDPIEWQVISRFINIVTSSARLFLIQYFFFAMHGVCIFLDIIINKSNERTRHDMKKYWNDTIIITTFRKWKRLVHKISTRVSYFVQNSSHTFVFNLFFGATTLRDCLTWNKALVSFLFSLMHT